MKFNIRNTSSPLTSGALPTRAAQIEELRKQRPVKGDRVLLMGDNTRYIVAEAGMKALRIHPEDNPKSLQLVLIRDVMKDA